MVLGPVEDSRKTDGKIIIQFQFLQVSMLIPQSTSQSSSHESTRNPSCLLMQLRVKSTYSEKESLARQWVTLTHSGEACPRCIHGGLRIYMMVTIWAITCPSIGRKSENIICLLSRCWLETIQTVRQLSSNQTQIDVTTSRKNSVWIAGFAQLSGS
jgi:hypothetical protein